jgi:hypothetical protein
MRFKEFKEINEGKQYLYHGGTHRLSPFARGWENHISEGNMQEGPGVYFSTIDIAQTYGHNIWKSTSEHNDNSFIKSRASVKSQKSLYNNLPKFLRKLWKKDPEPIYYEISNWIEIHNPEDIKDRHFDLLTEKLKDEETRNFLITYADLYPGKVFIEVFNSVYPNIKGTYNPKLNFYALLKPINIEKINL